MPNASWDIRMAFSQRADFAGTWDNITRDVRKVRWVLGFPSRLDRIAAIGKFEIELDNSASNQWGEEAIYSPGANGSIEAAGELGLYKRFYIGAQFNNREYTMFNGFLTDIIPNPDPRQQTVKMVGYDGLYPYITHRILFDLLLDKRSDEIIDTIIDDTSIRS